MQVGRRQATQPVVYNKSVRKDAATLMTSGRAGKVYPLAYIPLLREDSASGRVAVEMALAEMPRPLLNAVFANFQAWFVPKEIDPRFASSHDAMAAYVGEDIETAPSATRSPPSWFNVDTQTKFAASEFAETLGVHCVSGLNIQTEVVDAFVAVHNFRLAAHSSKLTRKSYMVEDVDEALELPRAFWPTGPFSHVVPDYERALVVGALDLDVSAGKLRIRGLLRGTTANGYSGAYLRTDNNAPDTPDEPKAVFMDYADAAPIIFADMAGEKVTVSLNDIDMARKTQAFAKLRSSYAGVDVNGFVDDDAIMAHLMQGLRVPQDAFKRPILLDAKRVAFGLTERHATDGASLDESVTTGRAGANLSINVPATMFGGTIVVIAEVLPERIYEAQSDEWLHMTAVSSLPDALRDIQRIEPVDQVLNRRVDARHTTPNALYGYEPMNAVWNRNFTRLGGSFYQPDPNAPVNEQRAAIWQSGEVDPQFSDDHFLAPVDFPHDVFADTEASAWEAVVRHSVSIVGLTQFGDVLAEDNGDFEEVNTNAE